MESNAFTGKKYWNPYITGIGIGLTLLAAFIIMGRGLGASGGLSSIVSYGVHIASPNHAASNGMFSSYLQNQNKHPLADILVFEVLGIAVGGFLSGWASKRLKFEVEKGPQISSGIRLTLAFTGGLLMGFAAKLARGCTSGQALTGGSLLNLGSWIFMLSVFAGAYAMAYLVRRQWR